MIFESWPEIQVDVAANGSFNWAKQRSKLEFSDTFKVLYRIEAFEASDPLGLAEELVLTGTITESDGEGRVRFKVASANSDRYLYFDALLLDSELLCDCYCATSGARFSKLFWTKEIPKPFPRLTARDERKSRLMVVRDDAKSDFSPRNIAPKLLAPLKGDNFLKALRRLNYELRKHSGNAASVKLRTLEDHQRDFLAHVLAGPLDFLKQDSAILLRDNSDPQARAVELPKTLLGNWSIVLGTAQPGGAIVAYRCDGFSMVDRTIVG